MAVSFVHGNEPSVSIKSRGVQGGKQISVTSDHLDDLGVDAMMIILIHFSA